MLRVREGEQGAQAVGADAGAHGVLQPRAPHKVVLADVQVAHRRVRQRVLHPNQTTCETPTHPCAETTTMHVRRMLLCCEKSRVPHRKLLPGAQADLEVLAHVQAPDAPLQQHGRQPLQLRIPKALQEQMQYLMPALVQLPFFVQVPWFPSAQGSCWHIGMQCMSHTSHDEQGKSHERWHRRIAMTASTLGNFLNMSTSTAFPCVLLPTNAGSHQKLFHTTKDMQLQGPKLVCTAWLSHVFLELLPSMRGSVRAKSSACTAPPCALWPFSIPKPYLKPLYHAGQRTRSKFWMYSASTRVLAASASMMASSAAGPAPAPMCLVQV